MDHGYYLRWLNWLYADLEIKANSMRIFVVVTLLGYHSNTARYLEIQAELTKSKAAYEKAMADIKAACGTDAVDESGAEVACKAVAK